MCKYMLISKVIKKKMKLRVLIISDFPPDKNVSVLTSTGKNYTSLCRLADNNKAVLYIFRRLVYLIHKCDGACI